VAVHARHERGSHPRDDGTSTWSNRSSAPSHLPLTSLPLLLREGWTPLERLHPFAGVWCRTKGVTAAFPPGPGPAIRMAELACPSSAIYVSRTRKQGKLLNITRVISPQRRYFKTSGPCMESSDFGPRLSDVPDFVKAPEVGRFGVPLLVDGMLRLSGNALLRPRGTFEGRSRRGRVFDSPRSLLQLSADQTCSSNVLREVEGLSSSVVVDRSETKGPRGVD
jgi:hypothetical protein